MLVITQNILNAISKDVLWSVDLFFKFIEQLQKKQYIVSYWENEENWASISFEGTLVGYLWKKYPLLFIEKKIRGDFNELLNDFEFIVVITVDSLTEKCFKVDYSMLKDTLDYGVNYDAFSAEDLWFHTNSI
jgi:hypothetical protein